MPGASPGLRTHRKSRLIQLDRPGSTRPRAATRSESKAKSETKPDSKPKGEAKTARRKRGKKRARRGIVFRLAYWGAVASLWLVIAGIGTIVLGWRAPAPAAIARCA